MGKCLGQGKYGVGPIAGVMSWEMVGVAEGECLRQDIA